MSEHTPDHYGIKAIYVAYGVEFSDDRRPGEDYGDMAKRCEAEFDRWLAQHEAEIVARTLNAVSAYLYEADLIEAVSQGRVSLIFNELTDDEWLDWLDDAESLIKRGN